jgi:uncharacterized protein (TIGR00159 family)
MLYAGRMGNIIDFLAGFGPADALDIAIVSTLIYLTWSWFKRTRAAFVAIGMFILGGIYLLARILNLVLTAYLFQGFFAIFLFALIVIFQEELRHFFERLAVLSLLGVRRPRPHPAAETEELVQTLGELAQERNGALVVLRGRDPIERHITEGYLLDGMISMALLKSIFDPHSEGHDGALVIGEKRVERFGVYLPLGRDLAQNARLGTRHAAALGLSELTDSMCLVVSEERGRISIAHNGVIQEVHDLGDLRNRIEAFFREAAPAASPGRAFWRVDFRDKAVAVLLSLGLWFQFVHRAKSEMRQFDVPVALHNVPGALRLEEVSPATVRATLSGPRLSVSSVDAQRLRVHVSLAGLRSGESDVILPREAFAIPEGLSLVRSDPPALKVRLGRRTAP